MIYQDMNLVLDKLEDIKELTSSELSLIEQLSVLVLPDKVVNQSKRLKGAMINPVTSTNGLPKYLAIRLVATNQVITEIKTQWNKILPNLGSDMNSVLQQLETLQVGVSAEYNNLKKIEDAIKKEISDRTLAINNLTDGASSGYDTLKGLEDKLKKETTNRDNAIQTAINGLINSAPGTLDTLQEIAKALGDDPNFAATITKLINDKFADSKTYADNKISQEVSDRNKAISTAVENAKDELIGGATERYNTFKKVEEAFKLLTGSGEDATTIEGAILKSKEYTDQKISEEVINRDNAISALKTELLNGAGEAFDTLKELADALGNDPNFATTILNKITEGVNQSKAYTNTKTTETLNQSKTYTDEKISKLSNVINTTVECSHEVEITGNTGDEHGLAVSDQQMLLTRIEGQSRRASLNIVNLPDTSEITKNGLTYSVTKGVVKVKGTITNGFNLIEYNQAIIKGTYTICHFNSVKNSNITIIFRSSVKDYTLSLTNARALANMVFNEDIYKVLIYANGNFTNTDNLVFTPMLVEGTYTQETLPAFKPYDDNLVNSNCKLISTGRNLYSGLPNGQNGTKNSFELLNLNGATIPKGRYYITFKSATPSKNFDVKYYLSNGTNYTSNPITPSSNTKEWFDVSTDNVIKLVFNAWNINYGLSEIGLYYKEAPTAYEPHKTDELEGIGELGAFDYIENGKKYLQTSQMITLNGSESGWQKWNAITEGKYRFGLQKFISNSVISNNTINVASNYIDGNANNTYFAKPSIAITNNEIIIYVEDITEIEAFKTWLQANPITFVYKLATPTISDVSIPAGYAVYNGGIQIQEGDLPYKLYKRYSLSMASQILANIEVDREQQDMIEQNAFSINDNKMKIEENASDIIGLDENIKRNTSLINGLESKVYSKNEVDNIVNTKINEFKNSLQLAYLTSQSLLQLKSYGTVLSQVNIKTGETVAPTLVTLSGTFSIKQSLPMSGTETFTIRNETGADIVVTEVTGLRAISSDKFVKTILSDNSATEIGSTTKKLEENSYLVRVYYTCQDKEYNKELTITPTMDIS